MKIPPWLPAYGDLTYRGECPLESAEQATFFNVLRSKYTLLGKIALHPKNEGKRVGGQFRQLAKDKALGLAVGAADIVIPGSPTFVCEMKRRDHTLCSWQPGQLDYLAGAKSCGAFVCVAFGYQGALDAVEQWLSER
jgi:hypothetical protein